jgi:D-sedoheptulose 7-phosphate isomerase
MEMTGPDGTLLSLAEGAAMALQELLDTRKANRVVALVGNGGSAAIAGHMQIDLTNSLGVKTVVFSDTPTLTALSNDYGYAEVYERQLRIWAHTGDLLIAISSSGRSENILRAANAALDARMRVITLSGFKPDNPLRKKGHINLWVNSACYGEVELAHACMAHYLTDQVLAVQGSLGQRRPALTMRRPVLAKILLRPEEDLADVSE